MQIHFNEFYGTSWVNNGVTPVFVIFKITGLPIIKNHFVIDIYRLLDDLNHSESYFVTYFF